MKFMKLAAYAVFCIIPACGSAKTLNIALDVSASVPLIHQDAAAAAVAAYLKKRVNELELGDQIEVKFVGEYGAGENFRQLSLRISRQNRASEVASAVERIVAGLPRMQRDSKIRPQEATNLIGYLEDQATRLRCDEQPTEIIMITDGIESSTLVDGLSLVTGKSKLPAPSSPILSGCLMTMIGIGQINGGGGPMITRNLVAAWTTWAAQAGIKTFSALPSF